MLGLLVYVIRIISILGLLVYVLVYSISIC